MYHVIEIIEPDFGCEGLPEGQEPVCEVVLEDETGKCITVKVPDRELYAKEINEGSSVIYTNSIITRITTDGINN